MSGSNYFLKITVLFLATGAGIFAIWYALIREDSAVWLTSQVVHQASPYAVTETDDGLIIGNVVAGYEFSLPRGFKSLGARNLTFYLGAAGEKTCEIRHYVKKSGGKLKAENLIFELVDKNENGCEKYLSVIKNSVLIN